LRVLDAIFFLVVDVLGVADDSDESNNGSSVCAIGSTIDFFVFSCKRDGIPVFAWIVFSTGSSAAGAAIPFSPEIVIVIESTCPFVSIIG
jgi:hypothetical protein